jgi:hypothetical protein
VHRGKNRESQVTKVAKSGDSAKHRYSLDDTKFRKVQRSVLKLWKTWISKTEPRAKTPIQSASRKRSKNGNSPETAKYQESTPASRFSCKFILCLATGTDTRGDVPTQSLWPQYLLIYLSQVSPEIHMKSRGDHHGTEKWRISIWWHKIGLRAQFLYL